MSKKIGLLITFHILTINSFSQQSIISYLPSKIIDYQNVNFNRNLINPSLSNDSVLLNAFFIAKEQWVGFVNALKENNIDINGRIPNTGAMIGIDFGFNGNEIFKNQILKFNYNQKIRLNETSDFKAGINIGISRFKYDPYQVNIPGFTITTNSEWTYLPTLDIGVVYRLLNQHVGISYLDIIPSYIKSEFSNYKISNKILLVGYYSNYRITKSIGILPELIIIDNKNKLELIARTVFFIHNKIFAGFMIDDARNYGFLISGIAFKYIEIGYLFDYDKSQYNKYSYGTHCLKLGIMIK